ncbi:hypothetical protein [Rossellomorea marisflavi]|uniref:hypothetical protein n=1 Tax=Rossellomorea marisflavi TaxID=189381 RepID=UPI00285357D1|nr:hypothetical protein [Rossellomorea marisflavi]MDR4938012.1 hypothetical protein [Rossellomorea marisflavi]
MTTDMKAYWNERFENGAIWGTEACPSAQMAVDYFKDGSAILVPGCGYGRNSSYLAKTGYVVDAYDISEICFTESCGGEPKSPL